MQTKRISKDEYYLNIAKAVTTRSTCLKRNYGAVIVKNDEIIATGYNGSPRDTANCCDVYEICPRFSAAHNSGDYSDCKSVHAEQNAIISASRNNMLGGTIYLFGIEHLPDGSTTDLKEVTPCPICARMITNAGITRIVGPQDIKPKE